MATDAGAGPLGSGPAGLPWLAIDLAGPGRPGRGIPAHAPPGDVDIIDLAGPDEVPVTVNPLQPAPGCPVQAHADRLAGLFQAAFGLAGPVAAAVRTGLGQVYADAGWDARTGAAAPGAAVPPAVPAYRQLRRTVLHAAAELGYGCRPQAAVRGFVLARLDPLWAGPAGRFLEGGHPLGPDALLRGNVLVTHAGLADDEALSFLAGVLLIRLAEQHGTLAGPAGGRGTVIVVSAGSLPAAALAGPGLAPGPRPEAAGWFGRLAADLRGRGIDVVLAPPALAPEPGPAPASARPATPASASGPGPLPPGPLPPGRRSAACGAHCHRRPCRSYELHAATVLAGADEQAWLRLWVRTLVLAFLTGRPLPRVPSPLRSGWRALGQQPGQQPGPRQRECLLAAVLDDAIAVRALSLRQCYDPRFLTSVLARVASDRLAAAAAGGDAPAGASGLSRAGAVWVIPQLRWWHELERVTPLGRDEIRFGDVAPPLDYALAGLPDWPGVRVRDRITALRRHPLSAESGRNRNLATMALVGDEGQAGLDDDLTLAGLGLPEPLRLRHAARMMGAAGPGDEPGWLEVVLSWPRRMLAPVPDGHLEQAVTG